MLGPISGAHFNPVVSGVFWLQGELPLRLVLLFVGLQLVGGVIGTLAAHLMFEAPLFQLSVKARAGPAQWFAEWVATFGLVLTILLTRLVQGGVVAASVGLYIVAAYWFTASTSFANPAVTIARSLSDTFAGIAPADVPGFIVAQILGALAAAALGHWLFARARASRKAKSRPKAALTNIAPIPKRPQPLMRAVPERPSLRTHVTLLPFSVSL
jgi:glycerol uptake facilitator-like aquaporin